MKRILCIILILSLVICVCGCEEKQAKSFTFYYIHKDMDYGSDMPLLAEFTYQTNTVQLNYETIINQYFSGPYSNDYLSPFPKEMKLQSLDITSDIVTITLSEHIKNLTPSRQTTAFACITKTLTALTGFSDIQIIINDADSDSQQVHNFSNENFSYFDSVSNSDIKSP